MDLDNLKKTWEAFGEQDPFWAVLTWEGKENRSWEPEEFFKYGLWDVLRIFSEIEETVKNCSSPCWIWQKPGFIQKLLKKAPTDFAQRMDYIRNGGRCLDFGCGVGRLTLPLAERFMEAIGLDISSTMIAEAQKWATNISNCRFVENNRNDLSIFESNYFDCVISMIVLQHIAPDYQKTYIEEFVRVLAYDGIACFQLPDKFTRKASYSEFSEQISPEMEMHGKEPLEVKSIIESAGAKVLNVMEDESAGVCRSYRYILTKEKPRRRFFPSR